MGKFISGVIVTLLVVAAVAMYGAKNFLTIDNTVVTTKVADDVSAEDVIEAMQSKSTEINMKYVGSIPLYQELRARGVETGHLEIFQFCNPTDARKMVNISPSFAAYLPCRITLVEGQDKKLYLTMMDLGLLIKTTNLNKDLLEIAHKVKKSLEEIMAAGASGEF